ncbi:hypothetical protein [Tsuneonella amylolytica]|uniref:hypothetical protein n=1 Tax=Tsuneonella amylolytica TaxID=2338327 RepID=UPI000EAAAB8E|nr:hypothetical protein [Tsuneonella amylolytica]
MGGDIWSVVVIVGPILLLAAFIFGWWSNRNASRRTVDEAERGAVELRRDIEDDVPPPKS